MSSTNLHLLLAPLPALHVLAATPSLFTFTGWIFSSRHLLNVGKGSSVPLVTSKYSMYHRWVQWVSVRYASWREKAKKIASIDQIHSNSSMPFFRHTTRLNHLATWFQNPTFHCTMVRFAVAFTALLFTASTVDAATGVRGKDVADERDLRRRSVRCVVFCIVFMVFYGLEESYSKFNIETCFA